MQSRSQAALEFMVNYGWAIFMVVSVTVALNYFGYLDASSFIPNKCTFPSGFSCSDHQLYQAEGRVDFYVKNTAGGRIQDVKVYVPGCTVAEVEGSIENGEEFTVSATNCDISGSGKYDLSPVVEYTKTESGLGFTDSSNIAGTIDGGGEVDMQAPENPSDCPSLTCQAAAIEHDACTYDFDPVGTSCSGDGVCDGEGNCVECVTNNDCVTWTGTPSCDELNTCQNNICVNGFFTSCWLDDVKLDFEPYSSWDGWYRYGQYLWRKRSGHTPSSFTGPDGPYEGNYYAYAEASGRSGKIYYLRSPIIDLRKASGGRLYFRYHMYGADMGKLSAQVAKYPGSSYSSLTTISGQSQSSSASSFRYRSRSLSSYGGERIRVRFKATIGSGYRSDIAIDDVKVRLYNYDPNS